MTNSDYCRLHRVDSRVAHRELQGLVGCGAVTMKGVRGGAHYLLALSRELTRVEDTRLTRVERVRAYVRERGSITNAEARELLNVSDRKAVARLLKSMAEDGLLLGQGRGRGSRNVNPPSSP